MAFTDPQSLNDNSAAAQSFVRQDVLQGGSNWIENDATGTLIRKISFRHSNAGASVLKGGKPVRRHLVQFTHEAFNATLGKWDKATLNVTLTTDPGGGVITPTNIYDLRAFAVAFLTTGNIDKLMRDES